MNKYTQLCAILYKKNVQVYAPLHVILYIEFFPKKL